MRAEIFRFRPHFFACLAAGLFFVPASVLRAGDYSAELIAKAQELQISKDRYWLLLNHYRHRFLGAKSEIRNPEFFLSPRGRTDPQAELEATLRGFMEPAGDDANAHLQCRFPARYAWLKERLTFDPQRLKEINCPRLKEWSEDLSPDSVTMIFASAYLDNPSSMYGHTFLRLNQKSHGEKERLLDYVVNFAAVPNTNNGMLFAVYGLIGIFPGRFSAMPYYLKVQEYSNLESRDLWEYPLSLTPQEARRLILHLWELGNAEFSYYFFNKNCSYQLLPLLDVARPDLHLSDRWPLYVIPFDTVRTELQKGLATKRTYRPSQMSRMIHERSQLDVQEARTAGALARAKDWPWAQLKTLSPQRKALVLESATDYLQYLVDYRQDRTETSKGLSSRLLRARSEITIAAPPLEIPAPPPPESGHPTGRASLGYGYEGDHFLEADIRPALHDLLDPSDGYPEGSDLEMFNTRLRYDTRSKRAYVHALDLVRIVSLAPLDSWIRKPSWKVDGGYRQAVELGKPLGQAGFFGLTLGTGLSFETHFIGQEISYAFAEADGGAGGAFGHDYRIGAGPAAGVLMNILPRWRLQLEGSYFGYAAGDTHPYARGQLSNQWDFTKNLSLRAELQKYGKDKAVLGSLIGYF